MKSSHGLIEFKCGAVVLRHVALFESCVKQVVLVTRWFLLRWSILSSVLAS
jgi:hypothetical protein